MKIAVITANMGNFDDPVPYVKQSISYDRYHFNEENFLPRVCSMTPRLQARIPKIFGWQMAPGYDYYVWVDCSYALLHEDSVKWFVEQCQGFDIGVFPHTVRDTIQQEADYINRRLNEGCGYLTPRYKNELITEQLAVIQADKGFVDNHLFASTALVYHNSEKVQNMMIQWWYHTSRFHTVDQLALPYVIWKGGCSFKELPVGRGRFKLLTPYLTYIRGKYRPKEAISNE